MNFGRDAYLGSKPLAVAIPGGVEIDEDAVKGGDRTVEILVVEFDDGAVPGELVGSSGYRGKPRKGGANRDQQWEAAAAGVLGRLHPSPTVRARGGAGFYLSRRRPQHPMTGRVRQLARPSNNLSGLN